MDKSLEDSLKSTIFAEKKRSKIYIHLHKIHIVYKKMAKEKQIKIVYCTPALYLAGGMERVISIKANYFAEHYNYDITIVITDGKGKKPFYTLSNKVNVINLDINFEELWNQPFLKKIILYLKKQRLYKRKLSACLMKLHPDITISMLRREINFLTSLHDGSKKIGEIHINKAHFRTYEEHI